MREACLPGNTSCAEVRDASVYYAPLRWHRYVYPLAHVGPARWVCVVGEATFLDVGITIAHYDHNHHYCHYFQAKLLQTNSF